MSVIDVTRHHNLDHEHALSAANGLVEDLARDYDVHYQWQGDQVDFHRTGVKGSIQVRPSTLRVQVRLGLLLRPLKGKIEKEIHKHLDNLVER